GLEGFLHVLITRNMCQHTKFNLRIIAREDVAVWFTWHEGFSDLLSFFGAGRDILQVRIHTRKSTSRSQGLQVTRVNTAIWLDNVKQALYIGRLNLGNLTII